MSVSRREFLEASALSASGMVLSGLVPQSDVIERTLHPEGEGQSGAFDRESIARIVLDMNAGWRFFRPSTSSPADSSDKPFPPSNAIWETANLPHTVRLEPRDVSGGRNYQGLCWYKKSFAPQQEWNGRVIYLKFQGAMQVADVWMNDVHLTTHYGGYIPFTLDISKAIRFDRENILLVRLDNRDNPEVPPGKPQGELDFCYFGGLYRGVELDVRDRLHITDPILANKIAGGGIFVTFPKVGPENCRIQIQTEVENEYGAEKACKIDQRLLDLGGEVVAAEASEVLLRSGESRAMTQELHVSSPRLWHPDDPHLYHLHTTVSVDGKVIDEEVTRIGVRSMSFDKDRGLLINGQPFLSIGANRHQDHPYVGYALSRSAHYRDAYKLREAGFTSYRSHYPQDPGFMDACDELGILAIVSNPGWQFLGNDVFKKRVFQDAREMIRRDRNHPSVIIWEAALNESDNGPVAPELYRIAHEEYPGSACYTAGDPIHQKVDGFPGWDVEYVGGRHEQPAKPGWVREWGDQVDNWVDQQGRVRVARSWGETPMLVQATAHMISLDRLYERDPKPAGADLWAGIDASRGYHHQPFLGAPLDLFRLPKFGYYMFQSQRPSRKSSSGVGSGPMVFIANFATFHSPSTVMVFSNCEQVRLTQNGTLIGTQSPDSGYRIPHPPFTFKVGDFSPTRSMLFANPTTQSGLTNPVGQLVAEGLVEGKVVASHTVSSPGVPTCLRLHIDTCGIDPVADGSDWVRVYAHVCDARGESYPYGDDRVKFSVNGEGALIEDESIFANPVRAEAGIATALVRMSRKPGEITVRASSPTLNEAELSFESKACNKLRLL